MALTDTTLPISSTVSSPLAGLSSNPNPVGLGNPGLNQGNAEDQDLLRVLSFLLSALLQELAALRISWEGGVVPPDLIPQTSADLGSAMVLASRINQEIRSPLAKGFSYFLDSLCREILALRQAWLGVNLVLDHGLLSGLGDDDHPRYRKEAHATLLSVGTALVVS